MGKIIYGSPIGLIEIAETNGYISSLHIVTHQVENKKEKPSLLLERAVTQLDEYFLGKRKEFNLPLKQVGTPFQVKVWEYLQTIPYGQMVTYKEEAFSIGCPKAARAVGSANGKNNIPIIIPCHRVVATGGGLGGYAYGKDIKQKLLDLEKQYA